MKYLFSFLALIVFNIMFCQNVEIEGLINEASKIEIESDFRYYNLIDSSFIPEIHLDKYKIAEILKSDPDFPSNQFLNIKSNTVLNWNNYKLLKAKVISPKEIPKYDLHYRITRIVNSNIPKEELERLNNNKQFGEVLVIVDPNWSKEKIEQEKNKKVEEFEIYLKKYQEKVPIEDRKYYSFSTPAFSNDKKYALIFIHVNSRRSSCCGCGYIFKFNNERWVKIHKLSCSMN